jgi:hypothetical protein
MAVASPAGSVTGAGAGARPGAVGTADGGRCLCGGDRPAAGELLWALPRHLEAPRLRGSCKAVFDEADLVKFARRRPDAGTGEAFLVRARALLTGWREAAGPGKASDAVR